MIERFRHRLPAETMALHGAAVREDGEMNRRGIEARELQSVVEIGLIAAVDLSRFAPRRLEILDDCGADFSGLLTLTIRHG